MGSTDIKLQNDQSFDRDRDRLHGWFTFCRISFSFSRILDFYPIRRRPPSLVLSAEFGKKSTLETWPRTLQFLNRRIFQCAHFQIVKHRTFSIFDWRECSNFQARESPDIASRKSTNSRVCIFFSCSNR